MAGKAATPHAERRVGADELDANSCSTRTGLVVLFVPFAAFACLYVCISVWLVREQRALQGAPLSKLLSNLVYAGVGWYLEALVSTAAAVAYVLFVADTYVDSTPFGVFVAQCVCQMLILCQWVFEWASASNKLLFVFSFATLVHLLPLMPLFSAVYEGRCRVSSLPTVAKADWTQDWHHRSLSFVYILLVMRTRVVSKSFALFFGRLILDPQSGGTSATHLCAAAIAPSRSFSGLAALTCARSLRLFALRRARL